MIFNNADQQELDKFSQDYQAWWGHDGIFKTLHDINPVRLSYIQQFTALDNQKILDIGCGGGILAASLAEKNAQVTAIDQSQQAISVAEQYQQQTGSAIDYQVISVENLAKKQAGTYDVVCCLELLEHVPNPRSIVRAAIQLLKPGGKIFFSTLNRHPLAYIGGILLAEYALNLLPKGTHDYAKFICPAELAEWVESNHATLDDITGLSYNPFSRSARLTRNVTINYLLCATK